VLKSTDGTMEDWGNGREDPTDGHLGGAMVLGGTVGVCNTCWSPALVMGRGFSGTGGRIVSDA
jgi:hypothetical protein